jgi:hypothetical protein
MPNGVETESPMPALDGFQVSSELRRSGASTCRACITPRENLDHWIRKDTRQRSMHSGRK